PAAGEKSRTTRRPGQRPGLELDALVGASFLLHYAVTFDGLRAEVTLQPYASAVADGLLDDLTADAGVRPLDAI
ncbi:MAG: hypothetical protein AAF211_05425, partial [Myxococcota bacterium]